MQWYYNDLRSLFGPPIQSGNVLVLLLARPGGLADYVYRAAWSSLVKRVRIVNIGELKDADAAGVNTVVLSGGDLENNHSFHEAAQRVFATGYVGPLYGCSLGVRQQRFPCLSLLDEVVVRS